VTESPTRREQNRLPGFRRRRAHDRRIQDGELQREFS
jgi:hypothetical protein